MSLEEIDRQDEELADFDIGFQARIEDRPLDPAQTEAWQRGWSAADEDLKKPVAEDGNAELS
jgi:hypothetical protein